MVDMSHDSSSGVESGDPQSTGSRHDFGSKLGPQAHLIPQHGIRPSNIQVKVNGVHGNPHRRDLSWSTCSDSDMRSGSVFSSSDTENNSNYRNMLSEHQPIIMQQGRQTPTMQQQRNITRTFKSAPLKSKKHVTFQAANGIDPLIPCGEDSSQNKHYCDSNILYYDDENDLITDQYYTKQSGNLGQGQEVNNSSYSNRRLAPQQTQRQSPAMASQVRRQSPNVVLQQQRQSSSIGDSRALRQSPNVTSQMERQSPTVGHQGHRKSPVVAIQEHRQSPTVMHQNQRQSPIVMHQNQRKSPTILYQNQRQSPVVMQQSQRQSPVVMQQSQRQSPLLETAQSQKRLFHRMPKQSYVHQHHLSSTGDENSGYQGSDDDDVTTDSSSENHVTKHLHEISRFTPSPRTITPVPHGNDKLDLKKKSKLCYFDKLPDDVLVNIFSHLQSDQLCRSARVCKRWYFKAYEPSLWTSIRINNALTNIDKALKTLTRRLSYDTPTVCVMVEKINLNGCELLSDKGLYTIAKRCPELRHLEITGCTNVSNIALFELVSRCVNLEHLNTTGCENITCISLTPQATVQAQTYGKQIDLRYLDMSDCVHLEDSGLQIIASYCSQLVYLYLRRCVKVTDIGVQYVANYCVNLKELSICDCKNVTDFGLKELSKLGSNLRYLSAAKCCKITDVGVNAIAKQCHRLRYLNVRGCEGVSDESVETLAQNCLRLRSLDIGKCDITDDSLHALAERCTQLRKLSLKSCDAITDKGITSVAERCRQLQQLNIQECHLTVNAYRTVKALCKKCIIEHTNPGFY